MGKTDERLAALHRAALTHLRAARGWAQRDLARAAGVSRQHIYGYEGGRRPLVRKRLRHLAGLMGWAEPDIELSVQYSMVIVGDGAPLPAGAFGAAATAAADESGVPEAFQLPAGKRLALRRIVLQLMLQEAARLSRKMLRLARDETVDGARQAAAAVWQRLEPLPAGERRALLEAEPELLSWALAELLCGKSVAQAPNDPKASLDLATLAAGVADAAPGLGAWRPRLRGYCLAHVANAERVGGDLAAADARFAAAWKAWRSAAALDGDPLGEWRLYDLEASLRRDRRQFERALACLDSSLAGVPVAARAKVLLNKQFTLEQAGDIEGSLAVLGEAAPYLVSGQDARLQWVLEMNRIVLLCHLGRHNEAHVLIPELLRLTRNLGNKMDLARVLWLSGRIAAAQGRRGDARAAFERVRDVFVSLHIGIDAALVSLELAIVHLEDGRRDEVARLAEEMVSLFGTLRMPREVIASLKLFCDAAQDGGATSALARQSIQRLETARGDARSRWVVP